MSRAVSPSTGSRMRWSCCATPATRASRSRSTTCTSTRSRRACAPAPSASVGCSRSSGSPASWRRTPAICSTAAGRITRACSTRAGSGDSSCCGGRSTAPPGLDPVSAWTLLLDGFERVLGRAAQAGVAIGLEPEGGMLIERLDDFETLVRRLGDPPGLGLTLDLGHCAAVEPVSVEASVRRSAGRLVHVHAKDMLRRGAEQLMLGDGDLELPAALRALGETGYEGLVA